MGRDFRIPTPYQVAIRKSPPIMLSCCIDELESDLSDPSDASD